MAPNESKNKEKKDNSNHQIIEQLHSEIAPDSLALLRRRRNMASEYGSRKKYQTNQRLDGTSKEQEGPPDGFIFDR